MTSLKSPDSLKITSHRIIKNYVHSTVHLLTAVTVAVLTQIQTLKGPKI